MRIEHVRPSKSQAGHLARVKENEALKKAAKESGKPVPQSMLKREPKGPREGFTLNMDNVFEKKTHLLTPIPYVFKPMERAIGDR